MSLNGLDSADVQTAYQVAVVEAGGWFLLKYTTRDSVQLLGKGKGGVHEARAAIASYVEPSPLYGVIVYRRRKVLIKHVPEGTSRVLLARTAVHFQDVIEKYSPYEALLEITSAEELTDTSLAASFPLHTATPSAASARLDEITEDGEDPGQIKSPQSSRRMNGAYPISQRHRLAMRSTSDRSPVRSRDPTGSGASPTSPSTSPLKTSVSQFLVRNESGKPSVTSIASESLVSMSGYSPSDSSVKDTESTNSTVEPSRSRGAESESALGSFVGTPPTSIMKEQHERDFSELRPSTSGPRQSNERVPTSQTRPSTSAQPSYDEELLNFLKPKQKLGPRPIAPAEINKRPTAASVATMPAPYRLSMRKQDPPRPPSQGATSILSPRPSKVLPTPPPIPDTPEYNPRPLSRGSIKSLPSHKSTGMTPDKIRLMKAVELRKKQLRRSLPQADTFVPPPEDEVPAVPELPSRDLEREEQQAPTSRYVPKPTSRLVGESQGQPASTSYKVDSGIDMTADKGEHPQAKRSLDEPPIEEQRSEEERIEAPIVAEEPSGELESDQSAVNLPRVETPQAEGQKPGVDEREEDYAQPSSLPDPPSSPKLVIPGAFSNPASPETEPNEPTFDPDAHLASSDNAAPDSANPPKDAEPAEEPASVAIPTHNFTSVPEAVMADGSRPMTPSQQQHIPDESRSINRNIDELRDDEASSNTDLSAYEMSPKRKNSDLARRRQGFIEPINVDTDTSSMSDSDDEEDSDDFIGEIHTATVQDAKPMVVARSPVQEFFSRPTARTNPSSSTFDALLTPTEPREVYIPSSRGLDSPNLITTPTVESSNPQPATYRPTTAGSEKNDTPVGLKRNVSNEISKRIQALAGTSSRETSPPISSASKPFNSDVPSTSRSTMKSPTHSRNSSFKAFSRHASKLSTSSVQVPQPTSQQQHNTPTWTIQRDPLTNRESVSVSTRIVRENATESKEGQNTTEGDLQPPPLLNHQREAPSQPSVPQLQPLDTNSNTLTSNRESTPMNSPSPTLSRASSMPRTSSLSNPLKALPSPTVDDFPPVPVHRPPPSISTTANDENAAYKEGSRTSRFFKRMSNIGGKRKSGMLQFVDRDTAASTLATARSNEKMEAPSGPPPPVVVGDLNVQFPDSLLWKRRVVAIDDTGGIKFYIPQAIANKSSSTRRFPLAEFRQPYAPDLDRQELPNSIMLDFVDGTTLQIACEDSVTHVQVAHALKTYWMAWSTAARAE